MKVQPYERLPLVGIAGLAGAGKEKLKRYLSSQFSAGIVEMSDFFIPDILSYWNGRMSAVDRQQFAEKEGMAETYLRRLEEAEFLYEGQNKNRLAAVRAQKVGFRAFITYYFNEQLRKPYGPCHPIQACLDSLPGTSKVFGVSGVRMAEEVDYLFGHSTFDAILLYVDAEERLGMKDQGINELSLPSVIREAEKKWPKRVFRIRNNGSQAAYTRTLKAVVPVILESQFSIQTPQ